MVEKMLGTFIITLLGVVLAPIIYIQATTANVGGTTAIVLALTPVFFVLGVLMQSIKGITK
jgi:hypothetical protein